MSEVKTLHRQAMDLAERASSAQLRGLADESRSLSLEALQLESQAARLVEDHPNSEPTRSILYRSAASLAVDGGEWREAERLIFTALLGNPPDSIAEELRDLLEQVHFERHLDLRGWELQDDEVQLSLAGSAVGFGVAHSDDFIGRVQNFEKLIYRTAERKSGLKYREGGSPKKAIQDEYSMYLSVPRAASFAVSLRVRQSDEENRPLRLPGVGDVGVINELLECLELFNNSEDEALRTRIEESSYYNNFMGLARVLSPDGDNVSFVGFTSNIAGRQKKVALTRTRRQAPAIQKPDEVPEDTVSNEPITVSGTLRFADDLKNTPGTIKLESEHGGEVYTIIVPEGWMDDIVRPQWGNTVTIEGYKTIEGIHLEDIYEMAD